VSRTANRQANPRRELHGLPLPFSHHSAPKRVEVIRAPNAVLKAQQSTFARGDEERPDGPSAKFSQTRINAKTGQER
jgi:hypothetical protein